MCNVKSASLEELQASMWSSEHSDWDDTFRVNVTAHYFLSVALLKLLVAASELDLGNGRRGRDEGRGVIIITSSCASMHNCTNIDLTSYAASKAAIDHLVPLLASKFAKCECACGLHVISVKPRGLTFWCSRVCPGQRDQPRLYVNPAGTMRHDRC